MFHLLDRNFDNRNDFGGGDYSRTGMGSAMDWLVVRASAPVSSAYPTGAEARTTNAGFIPVSLQITAPGVVGEIGGTVDLCVK